MQRNWTLIREMIETLLAAFHAMKNVEEVDGKEPGVTIQDYETISLRELFAKIFTEAFMALAQEFGMLVRSKEAPPEKEPLGVATREAGDD